MRYWVILYYCMLLPFIIGEFTMSNRFQKYIIFIFLILIFIPNNLMAYISDLEFIISGIGFIGFWLYLPIGSIFFGLVEGILIAKIYKVQTCSTIFKSLFANFIFIFLYGNFFLDLIHQKFQNSPISEDKFLSLMLSGGSILLLFLPYVIKWPFSYWSLKNIDNKIKKSIHATLIAQTAHYLVFVLFFILIYVLLLFESKV